MFERSAVQTPMLQCAQEIGWEYVRPEEALLARVRDGGFRAVFADWMEYSAWNGIGADSLDALVLEYNRLFAVPYESVYTTPWTSNTRRTLWKKGVSAQKQEPCKLAKVGRLREPTRRSPPRPIFVECECTGSLS